MLDLWQTGVIASLTIRANQIPICKCEPRNTDLQSSLRSNLLVEFAYSKNLDFFFSSGFSIWDIWSKRTNDFRPAETQGSVTHLEERLYPPSSVYMRWQTPKIAECHSDWQGESVLNLSHPDSMVNFTPSDGSGVLGIRTCDLPMIGRTLFWMPESLTSAFFCCLMILLEEQPKQAIYVMNIE